MCTRCNLSKIIEERHRLEERKKLHDDLKKILKNVSHNRDFCSRS